MYNLEGKVQKTLSNNETHFIVDNNSVVVCPWFIRNGYTNITETGRVSSLSSPDAFGFFQKVFTGNECITATWENSTKLVKPVGVNAYDYQFQVGRFEQGAIVVGSGEYGTEIESMESMQDFLSMKTQGQITIRFENWVPDNLDVYKLYTLPELYNNKWYYISNVRILNDLQFSAEDNTTSIPCCEVTFTSLVDKLQNTGKAVEQFVQYGAIGEPYAKPYIRKYEDISGGYPEPKKEVGYITQQPRHSKYLQLELFGANAISGLQVIGRKITKNADGTFRTHPWKFLLPLNFYNAQSNDINKTSLATKNFYYFPNETLVYRFSQNLWTAIKNVNDALATNHNSGQFSMSNKSGWTDEAGLRNGLHKSNPLEDIGSGVMMHKDYNDPAWYPILSNYSLSANGCYYCADTMNYTTSDTMLSILTKNGFVYSTQEVLPLGFYSSKPYKISNLPILGGLISKLGGDWTISSRTKQRKPLSIGYFMDCDTAGMLANLFDHTFQAGQDETIFAPTLALAGGEKAPKWLGTTACNTTLLMELTDKMLDNGNIVDTELLGQNKKPDLTWIDPTNHTTYLYNGQQASYHPSTEEDKFWFVIDDIDIYAMHNGDIRVSAYENVTTNPTPIFNTTVKSTANWTNSIRDWKTEIKTGCWSDYWCEREDEFTWPLNPSKPMFQKISTPQLTINNSDTNIFNSYETGLESSKVWPSNSQTGYTSLITNGNYKMICRNDYNEKVVQFRYDELGIPDVSDRASFAQKVGAIRVNYERNSVELKNENPITHINLVSGTLNNFKQDCLIQNISTQQTISWLSNLITCDPLSTAEKVLEGSEVSSQFNSFYDTSPLLTWRGGFTSIGRTTINLNEEYLEIKFSDNSRFGVEILDFTKLYYCGISTGSGIRPWVQLRYNITIDNIEFIPR